MKTTISTTINSSSYSVSIDEATECPICKFAIKPHLLSSPSFTDGSGQIFVSATYLCKACHGSFLCQYKIDINSRPSSNSSSFKNSELSYIAPNMFVTEKFEPIISNSFADFVTIYNQALSAESQSLSEISGIGYRKSLEFLIKDFLILKNPEKEESIKNTVLGNCINNFIDNPQLKTAASRAVWLGNDQTHYIQKFTDKDVTDLKRLIRLTVHWISMILETEEAEKIEQIK